MKNMFSNYEGDEEKRDLIWQSCTV